jgi:hypothetical protein
MIIVGLNHLLLPKKNIGSMPILSKSLFTMPSVGERISINTPLNIIQDKKLGRYITVCTERLNASDFTSFRSIATVIGIMRFSAILKNAIITVFLNASMDPGILRRYLKLSRPTHCWSPNNPRAGMNFCSAMTKPPIGTYEKMKISTTAGISIMCIGNSRLKRMLILLFLV